MAIIISKFGGTSVSTLENWQNIAQIVKDRVNQGLKPVIVCSALSQASNKLEACIKAALVNQFQPLLDEIKCGYVELANQMKLDAKAILESDFNHLEQLLTGVALLKEASPKTQAQILAFGELLMTKLGNAFLNASGISTTWFDARDGIKSKKISGGDAINYLAARCHYDKDENLIESINQLETQVVITQGFIASNELDETVLLGRGGSDTSAAIFAAKLDAKACEIWTDVPGIYTANPHLLPQARLLKQLNYDEAQEIASMGAKVLHPNSIGPVRKANIPLFIKYTKIPHHEGTQISHQSDDNAPPIKSVQLKNNVILISIDTLNMWQQVGFLADVFQCFKENGFSVDLLSTSEFNVTLSLDTNAKLKSPEALNALLDSLNKFSHAKLIEPCAVVSLIGQNIRTILHQLGSSLEVFESEQVHMMSLASNDLNLNFVVNESQAAKLSQKLHAMLIENNPLSFYYSKSWQEEFGSQLSKEKPWWELKKKELLNHAVSHSPCYIYDNETLNTHAHNLLALKAIDKVFYAIKANSHPDILKKFHHLGLNFECVSVGEIEHVLKLFPTIDKTRLLFTPNFANRKEYEKAIELGCYLTIDNVYPLQYWPELFKNQKILLRIDPGSGAGHHKYVCTGGSESKFGIPQSELPLVGKIINQYNIKVTGLHAHFGSGILTPGIWKNTAQLLTNLTTDFPDVEIINLGGGLGIVERPGQQPLDLRALDESLIAVKQQYPQLQFWLEPGRYLVAQSGVILAKVTQTKQKGDVNFIGIETGMNSLIRPSLYGAYHEIINLSKLDEEKTHMAHIVGPICESGDTLGYSRMMPDSMEGDIILIANTGAYGHCMSSNYNLRPPAKEYFY